MKNTLLCRTVTLCLSSILTLNCKPNLPLNSSESQARSSVFSTTNTQKYRQNNNLKFCTFLILPVYENIYLGQPAAQYELISVTEDGKLLGFWPATLNYDKKNNLWSRPEIPKTFVTLNELITSYKTQTTPPKNVFDYESEPFLNLHSPDGNLLWMGIHSRWSKDHEDFTYIPMRIDSNDPCQANIGEPTTWKSFSSLPSLSPTFATAKTKRIEIHAQGWPSSASAGTLNFVTTDERTAKKEERVVLSQLSLQ